MGTGTIIGILIGILFGILALVCIFAVALVVAALSDEDHSAESVSKVLFRPGPGRTDRGS